MNLDRIESLRLRVEHIDREALEFDVKGGWTRHTTIVQLTGDEEVGMGEDVTYDGRDQFLFQASEPDLSALIGSFTVAEFSQALDRVSLFPQPPRSSHDRLYRRWAFESAALDLALRQAQSSLEVLLGVESRPLRFVVSTGLGNPPSLDALRRVLERAPDVRFKVDFAETWTPEFVEELAASGVIDTVDLKGHYRRSDFQGPPPNAALYGCIAELLPDVWLEDPWLDDATGKALAPHHSRITWDAPLHSVADIETLSFAPRAINIKPSRFGLLSELLRVYALCQGRGIAMYGGGQFELGKGRDQIQHLASLFHPDGANDVAPRVFNSSELPADVPSSPFTAPRAFGAEATS